MGREMIRLAIDGAKCEGHARCVARAPELFDVDEDGASFPLSEEIPDDQLDDARKAADACPERAITLHD